MLATVDAFTYKAHTLASKCVENSLIEFKTSNASRSALLFKTNIFHRALRFSAAARKLLTNSGDSVSFTNRFAINLIVPS